jgi:hypothetical protein
MGEYQAECDVDVPVDALWGVLLNFGDVSWIPGRPEPIFEGEGIGMIRSVVIPSLPTPREQLDAIDERTRTIHYHILDGNPMPISGYAASMQAVDLGEGRSRLVWRSAWEPDGVSLEEATAAVRTLYANVLGKAGRNIARLVAAQSAGSNATPRRTP